MKSTMKKQYLFSNRSSKKTIIVNSKTDQVKNYQIVKVKKHPFVNSKLTGKNNHLLIKRSSKINYLLIVNDQVKNNHLFVKRPSKKCYCNSKPRVRHSLVKNPISLKNTK